MGKEPHVRYAFYVYIFTGKTGAISLREMIPVAEFELPESASHELLASRLNARLPDFLRQQGLFQFIPLKRPSMERHQDGRVSICYYHNQKAYDIVYGAFPEYVMMPNEEILADLEQLYAEHDLDGGWYDERANLLAE